MRLRLLLLLALLPSASIPFVSAAEPPLPVRAEVIIYGGTAAGVVAGLQAKRMGRDVLLIEPSSPIGGLTTGGLGQTDIANKHAIGGLARECCVRIRRHSDQPEAWKWQPRQICRDGGPTPTDAEEEAMGTFYTKSFCRRCSPQPDWGW